MIARMACSSFCLQKLHLRSGENQDSLVTHPAQLPRERTAVNAEKIGELCAVVGEMVIAIRIRRQCLKVNLEAVAQTLLGQNANLGIEKEKLLRHALHQVCRYLQTAGTAHGAL